MVADGSLVESYVDEGAQKDTEIDSQLVQNASQGVSPEIGQRSFRDVRPALGCELVTKKS